MSGDFRMAVNASGVWRRDEGARQAARDGPPQVDAAGKERIVR